MADESGTIAKISDLAKESKFKSKSARWIPRIPLTVLAPGLVLCALVAVVVPNTVILQQASQESTQFLSDSYLSAMMGDVKYKVLTTVQRLYPSLDAVVDSPEVAASFPNNLDHMETDITIQKLAMLKKTTGADSVSCLMGRWNDGYNNTSPINLNTVNTTFITVLVDPVDKKETVANVKDFRNRTHSSYYKLDPDTLMPLTPNAPYFIGKADQTATYSVRAQLGVPSIPAKTMHYYTLITTTLGSRLANVARLRFMAANSPNPTYACAAGIRVDSSWNALLNQSKPSTSSVVAMLSQKNLTLVASSNTFLSNIFNVTGDTFGDAVATYDNFTLALRDSVYNRFGNFNMAVGNGFNSYVDSVDGGEPWIINMSPVNFSTYVDTDSVLVVAAIPRKDLFGVIDAAKKRSTSTVIGISVAMGVLVTSVFVAVALPLMKLAKAMGVLTNLDFAQLEESKVMDGNSLIWELYNVQTTFSTMVKAFAGGIKKNKEMVNRIATNSGSKSGGGVVSSKLGGGRTINAE
ncbi:hypothetical protein HK104_009774 [Borealophlyctis nickersoniae]|nr:hypothetical protein HK104_009774 [Borealophlyctis nickersoniae]